MPVATETSQPLAEDDSLIDEVERGAGYLIRARVPKFDTKGSDKIGGTAPSQSEIARLVEEAKSITKRATEGERQALEAAQLHFDLKQQAEQMRDNTHSLERSAVKREKALLQEREKLRKDEEELEHLRSAKHHEVLQKEAERAQTKADVLLQQKKHAYALQLITRHKEGHEAAMAEVQRLRLEKQEADLLLQRAQLLRSKRAGGVWVPTEIKPIKVMVNVQPEDIPEVHVASRHTLKGASAGSVIGTHLIPAEGIKLRQQGSAMAGDSAAGKLGKKPQLGGFESVENVAGRQQFATELDEAPVTHKWGREDFTQTCV